MHGSMRLPHHSRGQRHATGDDDDQYSGGCHPSGAVDVNPVVGPIDEAVQHAVMVRVDPARARLRDRRSNPRDARQQKRGDEPDKAVTRRASSIVRRRWPDSSQELPESTEDACSEHREPEQHDEDSKEKPHASIMPPRTPSARPGPEDGPRWERAEVHYDVCGRGLLELSQEVPAVEELEGGVIGGPVREVLA